MSHVSIDIYDVDSDISTVGDDVIIDLSTTIVSVRL